MAGDTADIMVFMSYNCIQAGNADTTHQLGLRETPL
jgi:hypothetical protein